RNRWACPGETRDISLEQFGPVEHAGICAEFRHRVFFTAPLAGAVYAIDDAAAFFIADVIEGANECFDCDVRSATECAGVHRRFHRFAVHANLRRSALQGDYRWHPRLRIAGIDDEDGFSLEEFWAFF